MWRGVRELKLQHATSPRAAFSSQQDEYCITLAQRQKEIECNVRWIGATWYLFQSHTCFHQSNRVAQTEMLVQGLFKRVSFFSSFLVRLCITHETIMLWYNCWIYRSGQARPACCWDVESIPYFSTWRESVHMHAVTVLHLLYGMIYELWITNTLQPERPPCLCSHSLFLGFNRPRSQAYVCM